MCSFFQKYFMEGGDAMVAMLWTQQIMLGKAEYAKVPPLLKERVKELLIDSGYEELAAA